ncbi:hypothetical protein ABZ491_16740 [Micromonospora rifamycinica]|uniref:hypothetical protein n=1 Tax=Micromonospora rifamycinica TaxID=291594 RepID=UPI0033E1C5A4
MNILLGAYIFHGLPGVVQHGAMDVFGGASLRGNVRILPPVGVCRKSHSPSLIDGGWRQLSIMISADIRCLRRRTAGVIGLPIPGSRDPGGHVSRSARR